MDNEKEVEAFIPRIMEHLTKLKRFDDANDNFVKSHKTERFNTMMVKAYY